MDDSLFLMFVFHDHSALMLLVFEALNFLRKSIQSETVYSSAPSTLTPFAQKIGAPGTPITPATYFQLFRTFWKQVPPIFKACLKSTKFTPYFYPYNLRISERFTGQNHYKMHQVIYPYFILMSNRLGDRICSPCSPERWFLRI